MVLTELGGATAAQAVSCRVSTAPINFGAYDPTAAQPATSTGYIDVGCTCSGVLDCVAFTYTLAIGAGASGSTSSRYMVSQSGAAPLLYNLFQDPAYSVVWGVGGLAQSLTYPAALFGSSDKIYLYGRTPARQNVASGDYSDAPAVTISF